MKHREPNEQERRIKQALTALTAELTRRMGITTTQAAVIVSRSDAKGQLRKAIPKFLL